MAGVSFTLRPVFEGDKAKKDALALSKELKTQDQVLKSANAHFARMAKEMPHGFREIERAATAMGRGIKTAFDSAVSGLDRFNAGVDKLSHKIINVRTAIAGLAAVKIGGALIGEAKAEAGAKARLRR